MLPRALRALIPVLLLSWAGGFFGRAQPTQRAASTPIVRYQFGDDPEGRLGWANPDFDDSAWPVAINGMWPEPGFYSDGFVWVRCRTQVPSDTAEPLAIRVEFPSQTFLADEVRINGRMVGSFGRVAPHAEVESQPRGNVSYIPDGVTRPGAMAQVAIRIWYPPSARRKGELDSVVMQLDQSRTLNALALADREHAYLTNVPEMILNAFVLLAGLTVLLVGRTSGNRNLLLYGGMVAAIPLLNLCFEFAGARFVLLSTRTFFPLQVLSQLPPMIITVEFIWRIHGLGDVWFKRLTQVALLAVNVAELIGYTSSAATPIVFWAMAVLPIALQAFNILTIGANLWVLLVLRRNRLIAVTMMLVPVASLISGFKFTTRGGTYFFDLAFLLSGILLSAVLAWQAWKEWRAREELRAEFDAAREVQERLVAPAVDLPGFEIQSAYRPARDVGGDFFFVREGNKGAYQDNRDLAGGAFVVIGDVSGKGLRAALTVSAIMGALRTMPDLEPARILAALNRGLTGQLGGGFVTCCAISISADGTAVIANAGHLQPYCNGQEVVLDCGLPLGIVSSSEYRETTIRIAPADRLTLITDGVLEATSPTSGELFGFDRAAAISSESAERVAQAAQAFGQEDDITVLTLTRLAVQGNPAFQVPQSAVSPSIA